MREKFRGRTDTQMECDRSLQKEKPQVTHGWINGGFFVANYKFLNLIKNDSTILEKFPLEQAAKRKQLIAYKHLGFWKCMDALRDKIELYSLWESGNAKWKIW